MRERSLRESLQTWILPDGAVAPKLLFSVVLVLYGPAVSTCSPGDPVGVVHRNPECGKEKPATLRKARAFDVG